MLRVKRSPPPARIVTAFSVVFLLSVSILFFTTCKMPGPERGSVTFEGLPTEYYVGYCQVSQDPAVPWATEIKDDGSISTFVRELGPYYQSLIGLSGPVLGYNKLEIEHAKGSETNDGTGAKLNVDTTGEDFTHTGMASVRITFNNTDSSKPSMNLGFNNVQFSNGHAVINAASSFFSLPETAGLFTLTDADEFNGKYAIAYGLLSDNQTLIYGFGGATSATALKGFKIENGSAAIPLYRIASGQTQPFMSFEGNDKPTLLFVVILPTETFTAADFADRTKLKYLLFPQQTNNGVTFTNGKAEASATGEGVEPYPTGEWVW